ncbi:MAG: sensor histidine kinase [Armatimonadota bacterium]
MNVPLLERAVTNLIDNAIKYSPKKSNVIVLAERVNEEVAIRVIDNGPGIPAEHIPRIFERFYRVDNARSRRLGGTGLGLAIVKHVAQAHHGRVDVVSKVGEGSIFSIHLPLTNSAESQKPHSI